MKDLLIIIIKMAYIAIKINKKISSINNYNKNIPIIIWNNKKNSNSNLSNEYTKTPVVFDTQKILNKNSISRNIKKKIIIIVIYLLKII